MTQEEFNEFMRSFIANTAKAAGTTPSSNYAHGPGGLFSMPGMRPQVVPAMVMPVEGLEARLPLQRSLFANEVFPILTGITASAGTQPTTACADGKTPGNLKVCNQTWPFGRMPFDSQVLQVDRLGLLLNRSEFVDQTLIGNPFAELPSPVTVTADQAFRNEKAKKVLEMFVAWRLEYAPLVFKGNPANTSSSTGYIEPYGLDIILNTGYKDTYTNILCPAADPLVKSFGALDIATNASAAVQAISEIYADRKYLAKRLGLGEVKYALVMRYSLFRKLTEIWPCTYYSYRCTTLASGSTNFISADEQVKLRDDMRARHYLLIEGEEVEVIVDDAVTETIPVNGVGQSDIYFVPLSAPAFGHNQGGAITYKQFFDMSNPVEIVNAGGMSYPPQSFQVVGGGRFLVYPKAPSNLCIQYGMVSRERLICEAPFLGARLTSLRYTWYQHERSPFSNDPYYFVDGGQYQFAAPYFYPPN